MTLRVVWISDTHADHVLWLAPGVTPPEDVMAFINSLNPDLTVLTGDAADVCSPTHFALAAEIFSILSDPLHYVLGNHDECDMGCYLSPSTCLTNVETALGSTHSLALTIGGYKLIGIRTEYWPSNKARVTEAELAYLESRLQDLNGAIPVVFGHHPVGEITGGGHDELLALFQLYHVGAYAFGHMHTAFSVELIDGTYHLNGDQLIPINSPTDCGLMVMDFYETGIEVDYRCAASPFDSISRTFIPCGNAIGGAMPEIVVAGGSARRGLPVKSGQTTVYHAGDPALSGKGLAKRYDIRSTGTKSGTSNLDVAHYAAATLSFTAATKTIADSASQLATIKTGDTIRVRGSALNDGVYTVATGNVAGSVVVTEALVNESAGAMISIYKRAAVSNNTVLDVNTQREWSRYCTTGMKVGNASNGGLYWYNAAAVWTLHAAAADLQMIAPGTLRIVGGAGQLSRFHVGDPLVCSGFSNAVNNLPGYMATTVAVNGSDLDITLDALGNTLISEAAGGSRAIALVTQNIFAYAAAANFAVLGGFTDWRIPDVVELISIYDYEAATAVPDATAFPSWSTTACWSGTTQPSNTANALQLHGTVGSAGGSAKTGVAYGALVRGGV